MRSDQERNFVLLSVLFGIIMELFILKCLKITAFQLSASVLESKQGYKFDSLSSPSDNPSTGDIMAIIDYVCGYACKGNEPTGAIADLFKDMTTAVDMTDANQVGGRSICAKMLIKTVRRLKMSVHQKHPLN